MPHSSYSRAFLDSASLAGGMLFSRRGGESRVLKDYKYVNGAVTMRIIPMPLKHRLSRFCPVCCTCRGLVRANLPLSCICSAVLIILRGINQYPSSNILLSSTLG